MFQTTCNVDTPPLLRSSFPPSLPPSTPPPPPPFPSYSVHGHQHSIHHCLPAPTLDGEHAVPRENAGRGWAQCCEGGGWLACWT